MEKIGSIVILCVILSIFLYSFFVSCFVMLVNCWLKAVAMFFAVGLGLLLKEIVRFACCEGFLLLRLDIRFQSLWVFVLWSQFHLVCLSRYLFCEWRCVCRFLYLG